MPGWGWLVVGALLLGAEMFLIDAQFYLVFLGVAALLVGLVDWLGLALSEPLQWLLFALLSVAAMLGFRKRLYERLRRPLDTVPEVLSVGGRLQLPTPLEPGQSCRVDYRGSSWSARNVDSQPISGEVVIAEVEGLTLLVRQH
ncbi:MAG: NfeD family protein [Steroidobacteraceae bacterium]